MRLCFFSSILIALTPLVTAQKLSVAELIEVHRQSVCSVSCESWRRMDGIGVSQLKALTGTVGLASGQLNLEIGPDQFNLDFRYGDVSQSEAGFNRLLDQNCVRR